MWRDEFVERSWRVLADLKVLADFVLIGGWGVYFWARRLKSRDIDIYIDEENFFKLQFKLQERNFLLKRNIRLQKFEAIIGDVEVDIYTPFMCNLAIPCSAVFEEKLYSIIEGFKVAVPEVLLVLKAQAAQQRWHSEKGAKDRVDIISILAFVDVKIELLKQLLERYDRGGELLKIIRRVVTESRMEYKILGLIYEKHGVRLKRLLEQAI